MRRNNFPPRPKTDGACMRAPEPPARKVFNCIIDDTALVAGVKKSTRDGIRKWVSSGAIRLFVPLYTLTQLDRLKKGNERISSDAREAVRWLDEITEMSDRVQLEGVDEAYNTWEEVEKFLLPETLLSMEDTESEGDDFSEELENSFNALDVSDGTSMSSSHSLEDPPMTPQSPRSAFSGNTKNTNGSSYNPKAAVLLMESPDRTARNSAELQRNDKTSKGTVPTYLQPLFNHILWRIHKETNPDAALASFILLTNDETKQTIAQKFGIRAKRLEQLRDAVGREDREYKNRLTVYKLENEQPKLSTVPDKDASAPSTNRPKSAHSEAGDNTEDEDVVLFKRAPRGPQAQNANGQRVWDPNDFGRTNQHNLGRGGRGARGVHNGPRGRGSSRGGRGGGFAPRGGPYIPPGPQFRAPPAPRIDPTQPIDPDSFARPTPRTTTVRGTRRKLWEPN